MFSMAYGTEYGLVIVDIVQKICLLNVASADLYGAQDPYSRSPRSPKQRSDTMTDHGRSPSIDQVSGLRFPKSNLIDNTQSSIIKITRIYTQTYTLYTQIFN